MIKNLTFNEKRLYELRINTGGRRSLTDVMTGIAAHAWCSPAYPEEGKPLTYISAGITNAANGFKIITCGIIGTISEGFDNKKRKKQIAKASGYTEDEIAIDIDEFIQRTRELGSTEDKEQVPKMRCYGDSIRYSIQTPKEGYRDIETIFGDAHLEALDEVSCLSSLTSVLGSVYFSRCHDLEGLKLAVVGGDVHGEKLTTPNGLENLRFVGGVIYYQDKEYSLQAFKKEVLGIKVKTLQ